MGRRRDRSVPAGIEDLRNACLAGARFPRSRCCLPARQPAPLVSTATPPEVVCHGMANKVIPFPYEIQPERAPILVRRYVVIMMVGSHRFAIDITAQARLLCPEPAAVKMIQPKPSASPSELKAPQPKPQMKKGSKRKRS